jgi:hypothetical protein
VGNPVGENFGATVGFSVGKSVDRTVGIPVGVVSTKSFLKEPLPFLSRPLDGEPYEDISRYPWFVTEKSG